MTHTTPMSQEQFTTPILFLIFNRPDKTRQVFEEIRKRRPTQLFVAGDGPRPNRPDDAELCQETRGIATAVDWSCEVHTLFREENLGCKYGPAGAFDWFFENVEDGIILEDDDLPDPSFFTFCATMLEKYRDNPQVMHIGGVNLQQNNTDFACEESYYFSRMANIWGWASWRRAWKYYDVEVRRWSEVKEKKLLYDIFDNGLAAYTLGKKFQLYYERKLPAYDGPWTFACLVNNGLCIYPKYNLISNIGYGPGATNLTISDQTWDSQPLQPMPFPLIHPQTITFDPRAEAYNMEASWRVSRSMTARTKWWLKSHFTTLYLFLKKLYFILQDQEYSLKNERSLMP